MRRSGAFCLLFLFLAAGCGPPVGCPRETPGGKRLLLEVVYLFARREAPGRLPPLGILCIGSKPMKVDIGYRRGLTSPWRVLAAGVEARQVKPGRFTAKYVWKTPAGGPGMLQLKITAVAADGARGEKIVTVDCVRPRSKVTFNPFSL